jgi:hypothetical protein
MVTFVVKVKVFYTHAMKEYGGMEVQFILLI